MKIIQITDTHLRADGKKLFGLTNSVKTTTAAFDFLRSLEQQPDFYVISGDLVEQGDPEGYKNLKTLIDTMPRPVYILPGNHDNKKTIMSIFAGHPSAPVKSDIAPNLCYTIENFPLKTIIVDTTVSGTHNGVFLPEVETWLKEQVNRLKNDPVIVFTHHVPYKTDLTKMDEPFENVERFVEILQSHNNIKLCTGHMHCSVTTMIGRLLVQTAPPVSMHIELDTGGKESGWSFRDGDPFYTLHHFIEGRINSHVRAIPIKASWEGPRSFDWKG